LDRAPYLAPNSRASGPTGFNSVLCGIGPIGPVYSIKGPTSEEVDHSNMD